MTSPASVTRRVAPAIERHRKPGVDLTIVRREHIREFHFTFRPLPGDRPGMSLWRLDALLREHQARVVRHEIFGSLAGFATTVGRMKRLFPDDRWPVTWVGNSASRNGSISGMHVMAVTGVDIRTISMGSRIVGRVFDDGHSRHCLLGDIAPRDGKASRETQTRETFEQLEAALGLAGMTMKNLARTWLFIDAILDWYTPFNDVRTEFFQARSLFDHVVPASTGIGARNPLNAALIAGAWAIQPNNGSVHIHEVPSPLQCPAAKYGSSFSRALQIRSPGGERLFVSGTASIARTGETAHVDDIRGQIDLTMNVVEAILASEKMTFADTTRATVYLKDIRHLTEFADWCRRNELSRFPAVAIQADVCRPELLFEIELDALTRIGPASATKEVHHVHA